MTLRAWEEKQTALSNTPNPAPTPTKPTMDSLKSVLYFSTIPGIASSAFSSVYSPWKSCFGTMAAVRSMAALSSSCAFLDTVISSTMHVTKGESRGWSSSIWDTVSRTQRGDPEAWTYCPSNWYRFSGEEVERKDVKADWGGSARNSGLLSQGPG